MQEEFNLPDINNSNDSKQKGLPSRSVNRSMVEKSASLLASTFPFLFCRLTVVIVSLCSSTPIVRLLPVRNVISPAAELVIEPAQLMICLLIERLKPQRSLFFDSSFLQLL